MRLHALEYRALSASVAMAHHSCAGGYLPQRNLSLANRLVADLPAPERALLLAQGEMVEMALHEVLHSAGQANTCVWFPVEGWVAQMLPVPQAGRGSTPTAAHMGLGIALVGNEGMLDTSMLLGAASSHLLSRVQAAGRAIRVGREPLHKLLQGRPALRERLHGYVHVRQRQLAQQALCMNYHAVEQRLVRCLLMARDRMHSSELFLTHDVLAPLLGVRRESVTQAASTLQRRGLVSYSRGYVMLLDEPALQRLACGCYLADLASYEESLGLEVSPKPVNTGGPSEALPELQQQSGESLGLLHGAQVRGVQAAQLGAGDASRNVF
jgi:CRP-like cAMP-binding protein